MKLVTLGAPRLDGPDAPPSSARRKQLALLTYLARQENREATRSQLADLLWEEGDRARARHSLRQAISGLRPLLGDLLTTDGQHVRLSGALPLDLAELERHHPDDAPAGPAPPAQGLKAGF
jgi:DNA-binding SARP family transcriptional activator